MFGLCSRHHHGQGGIHRCAEVPHVYHHVEEQASLEVHVDDFYALQMPPVAYWPALGNS